MTDVRVVIESDKPIRITVKSGKQDPLARLLADIKAVKVEGSRDDD